MDKKEKNLQQQVIGRFIFTTLLMGVVLFFSAGTINWWEGWAYILVGMGILIVSRSILFKRYPEMIEERMKAGSEESVKPWDKMLVPIITMLAPILTWILAGLDMRFGWSASLPFFVQVIALIFFTLGELFFTWALFSNAHFSSHVRIQEERGHQVAQEGPYRIVRHPGYLGEIVAWAAIPFLFSAKWTILPTIIAIAAYIIRTRLEDATLQEELPGYKDYSSKTKYRLFPGVW